METDNGTKNILVPKKYFNVANGIWGMKILFVNVYMIRLNADDWVLVDAGLRIGKVVPVDQFLWSEHIELVTDFERR